MSSRSKLSTRAFARVVLMLFGLTPIWVSQALAYEVAVGLGSTASHSATAAMGDISKWPVVAEHSWGPLANLVPIAFLPRSQQTAVFGNFTQQRAITELPYPSIRWTSSQPDIDFIESFGLTTPYVFALYEQHQRVSVQGQATADALKNAGVVDSMLTRDEIIRLKSRFPGKKIIMNTRSWTRDKAHLATVTDLLDGVTIEFVPQNTAAYIALDVAPFGVWAHNNNKELLLLMPPTPEDYIGTRYVDAVTDAAQAIYNTNLNKLPTGWMASDKIIFVPANYSWEVSRLPYVSEDSSNSVLAAVKALLMMRPQLDAGRAPGSNAGMNGVLLLLTD